MLDLIANKVYVSNSIFQAVDNFKNLKGIAIEYKEIGFGTFYFPWTKVCTRTGGYKGWQLELATLQAIDETTVFSRLECTDRSILEKIWNSIGSIVQSGLSNVSRSVSKFLGQFMNDILKTQNN